MPSALVLVHDAVPGRGEREVGTGGPALADLGFDVLVTAFQPGAPPVPDPADVDVIVVMGSAAAAYDDTVPWLGAELDLLARGTWMQFHDDAFTLPAGAQQLARNEIGLQSFACGPHLAVQFHPEITPDAFAAWLDAWDEAGERAELEAAVDIPALVAEIAPRADATEAACRTLVGRFCARAGVAAS